jgi:hypothetical protein
MKKTNEICELNSSEIIEINGGYTLKDLVNDIIAALQERLPKPPNY